MIINKHAHVAIDHSHSNLNAYDCLLDSYITPTCAIHILVPRRMLIMLL